MKVNVVEKHPFNVYSTYSLAMYKSFRDGPLYLRGGGGTIFVGQEIFLSFLAVREFFLLLHDVFSGISVAHDFFSLR